MRLAIALSLILGLFILGCLIAIGWVVRLAESLPAEPVEQPGDEISDGDFCGRIDEGREG
jgi:hypothetical protein